MRLTAVVTAAALVGFPAAIASAQPTSERATLTARVTLGSIQGTVSDDRGGPLAGAMVSALGATTALAITDARGRFLLNALPPGDYMIRVHMAGFVSSRRDYVRVGAAPAVLDRIQLTRVDPSQPLEARPIMTAGVAIPAETTDDPDHPHTETAWRLRHIKRSILKQNGDVVSIADATTDEPLQTTQASLFGRAFDNAATFFTDTPFSGEVNLLTTSAIGGGSLFGPDFVPRGVAYLTIGAPLAGGRWDVRAALNQSDLSSWIVAGTYASHLSGGHDYSAGVSFSTQQYDSQDGRPALLAAVPEVSRSVGELFGADRWAILPGVTLDYGARYARYDYLSQRSLISPHLGVVLTPMDKTHVTLSAAQRMLAPGAEEFLPSTTFGPWLPPERTFAPLAGETLRVERGRFFEIGVDRDLTPGLNVGVRHFQQSIDDQLTTLFGIPVEGGPKSPGHYYVTSAGAVDADGWAIRVTGLPSPHVRGSIDYSVAQARWISRGDMAAIAIWAPEAIRPRNEDVHDLTTSLDTDIPQTATRVFVLYKISDAFARGGEPSHATTDARFDVQVNQALPFVPLHSTRWEVLVGVRNLFRDQNDVASIYDELLVVRPPKRVIGGVLVKF
ncbi:MAG TPA: TonB-dependent receptor [Vicinamibacterales bacterium]|nr:TonB-dependent receptor [Vicinamibacterales bacterium]